MMMSPFGVEHGVGYVKVEKAYGAFKFIGRTLKQEGKAVLRGKAQILPKKGWNEHPPTEWDKQMASGKFPPGVRPSR